MFFRALAVLLPLALPAAAQHGVLVCDNDQGWEITVAFPPEDACIVDNVEGETQRVEAGLECRTPEPRQVFLLRENYSFAYRQSGEDAVIEGRCTRN